MPVLAIDFTWVDIVIVAVFVLYAFEGFEVGFIDGLFDFLSFVVSFILGLALYGIIGKILVSLFLIPPGFANAIGFFTIAFVSEVILVIFLRKSFSHLCALFWQKKREEKLSKSSAYLSSVNRFLGLLPAIASSFILLSFLLTTITVLPFSPSLKKSISQSKFGTLLVVNTQSLEKTIHSVFGQAALETLTFLTVKPQSNELVFLGFKTTNISLDEVDQEAMFVLVNKERAAKGIPPLIFDDKLTNLSQSFAKEMFERGYFSHYTKEGLSPFDRMAKANINFGFAGENLALAPSVSLAMEGLMGSEGHRANILSPDFKRVGIGVIDGGIYGKMFVQEFTD